MLDHGRGQELLVKETLHIQMTPSEEHINQDGGLEVPGCWIAVRIIVGSLQLTSPWEETTVLDHSRGQELLVKKALQFQMTPSEEHFNLDGGLEVPGCWSAENASDEEAGREERNNLQPHTLSLKMGIPYRGSI